MGTPRSNPRAAVSLQLAPALGDGWHHLLPLLLSTLSRSDQGAAGHRVPPRLGPTAPSEGVGVLGRTARSLLVRDYVDSLKGAIQLEYLPAYAPELNPTEYIWGHLKHHELGNFCARTFGELTSRARNRLRSMQRRQTLISAFWQQAELPL